MTNDELRKLERAATPGPWQFIKTGANYTRVLADERLGDDALICADELNLSYGPRPEDAELFVAMRNELPRLLDENDALKRELAAMRDELARKTAQMAIAREALDAIRDDYIGNGHMAGQALTAIAALESGGKEK